MDRSTLSQAQIIQLLAEALSWFEKEISWGVSPGELNHLTGRIGDHYARFSQFVLSPRRTVAYARDLLRHADRRYLGHNPLGAAMVLFLLLLLAMVALSGWMQTTDAYWGVEWVEETHEILVNILLVAIALHVAGVAHASWRHRENLPLAMITGWKRAPAEDDVA